MYQRCVLYLGEECTSPLIALSFLKHLTNPGEVLKIQLFGHWGRREAVHGQKEVPQRSNHVELAEAELFQKLPGSLMGGDDLPNQEDLIILDGGLQIGGRATVLLERQHVCSVLDSNNR